MFEPEELMARIVDLEAQLKVSEMAPPAAEQLIACLEGEIAKRDARIVELEADLTGTQSRVLSLQNQWRKLDAELAAIKAQEPVCVYCDGSGKDGVHECICQVIGLQPAPSSSAPVSEAKAQGVVMPERQDDQYGDQDAIGWNACLDEVACLNAALRLEVSDD